MGLIFGTDGIRGLVGTEITDDLAYDCGRSIAGLKSGTKILVAQDTRVSGDRIMLAFSSGAISGGALVTSIGIAPTPCVSFLTKKLGFDFGVVISASHNPPEYNGIKIFDAAGHKINEDTEKRIEKNLFIKSKCERYGKFNQDSKIVSYYLNHLIKLADNHLKLTVVLDCSNGAAYKIAPSVFKKLGAKVYSYNSKCDGENINNNCGALHIDYLKKKVKKLNADVGFAFDGDADRVIAVDGNGEEFDGDQIICFLAKFLPKLNDEKEARVVSTILTNKGIEEHLLSHGIEMYRSDVGDKYVKELMNKTNCRIGGEQAGHIIIEPFSNTGDGVLTAVVLATIMSSQNVKLEDHRVKSLLFQESRNIIVKDKSFVFSSNEFKDIKNMAEALVGNGRVVIRPSGTEPKIRVMVEHEDLEFAKSLADSIVGQISKIEQ